MTNLELIKEISKRTKLKKDDVDLILKNMKNIIIEKLIEDDYVLLMEFGKFEMVHKKMTEYNNLFGSNKKKIAAINYPKFTFSEKVKSIIKNKQ